MFTHEVSGQAVDGTDFVYYFEEYTPAHRYFKKIKMNLCIRVKIRQLSIFEGIKVYQEMTS